MNIKEILILTDEGDFSIPGPQITRIDMEYDLYQDNFFYNKSMYRRSPVAHITIKLDAYDDVRWAASRTEPTRQLPPKSLQLPEHNDK